VREKLGEKIPLNFFCFVTIELIDATAKLLDLLDGEIKISSIYLVNAEPRAATAGPLKRYVRWLSAYETF